MAQLMSAATNGETAQQEDLSGPPAANRHRLPDERVGLTHHFSIAGHEGYLTVGRYPNGQPGEIFIRMAKKGSTPIAVGNVPRSVSVGDFNGDGIVDLAVTDSNDNEV